MANLAIPENEMTSFDLPKVCIITGSNQNVSFKPVKFQWYPKWIGVFGIAPLIMIILMMVLMRRAKGELPFTEEAWAAWQKGKMLMIVSVFGSLVLLGAAIAAFGNNVGVGALLLIAAIGLPIFVGIKFLAGRGPTCLKIADGRIDLKIKSDAAATAIRQHLDGGGRRSASIAA